MIRNCRKLVALLLLAWLPLSAAAVPAFDVLCAQMDHGSGPSAQMHDGHAGHLSSAPDGADSDGSASAGGLGAACCHLTAYTAPPPLLDAREALTGFVPSPIPVRPYAFFPDQPQRPPLAVI